MLCISCGTQMRLVRVEPDDTMMVSGYEYQTFECLSCQEIERRLTFTRKPTPQPVQIAPVEEAAPVPLASAGADPSPQTSPASAHQDDKPPASDAETTDPSAPPASPTSDRSTVASPGRWARAVAKLRGMQQERRS